MFESGTLPADARPLTFVSRKAPCPQAFILGSGVNGQRCNLGCAGNLQGM